MNISIVKYHPFTKDFHRLLITEGYNQLRNFGNMPEAKHLCADDKGHIPHVLYPMQTMTTDESGKFIPSSIDYVGQVQFPGIGKAPTDFKITDEDLIYPIGSKWLEQMYCPVEGIKFFVMLDIKNNYGHRLLFNRIKHEMLPGKSYKNLKRLAGKKKAAS